MTAMREGKKEQRAMMLRGADCYAEVARSLRFHKQIIASVIRIN